jgi:hypothetical protein
MQDDVMVALARRLEAVERSNRFLRRVSVLGLGAALLVGTLSVTRPAGAKDPVTIDCQKLRVLDSKDRVRGVLAVANDDTPFLGLFDENGKARCVVTLDEKGYGSFGFTDEQGTPHITLATTDSGPAIVVRSTKKGSCISLASTTADTVISVKDQNDRARVHLGVDSNGKADLRLLDEKGGEVFKKP